MQIGTRLADVAVAVGGALVGTWLLASLFPGVPLQAGSVEMRVSVTPTLDGGVSVAVPPLGSVEAESFLAPARVVLRADSVDVGDVAALVRGSGEPTVRVPDDAAFATATATALALDAVASVAAALVLGLALKRRGRSLIRIGVVAGAVVLGVGLLGLATHDTDAYREPRRTGALAALPTLTATELSDGAADGTLAAQLDKLGRNLTGLYAGFATTARGESVRDDSLVVLVLPDGTPAATQDAVVDFVAPDQVRSLATLAAPPGLTVADASVGLADGTELPVAMSGEQTELVVLYLDPDDGSLRAVDAVSTGPAGTTLDRTPAPPLPPAASEAGEALP